ncbi:MAG: hypothetical protein ACTSU2_04280, partial [Promethearchaeota archaeon]
PTEIPQTENTTEIPPAPIPGESNKNKSTTSQKVEEEPVETTNIQHVKSASNIPKSGLKRIEVEKTPHDILHNLIIDVEEANLESHVGTLILQAKDKLSRLIPFHTTYFNMIMVGGKIKNSNKPNSKELVEEIRAKIKEWDAQF